MEYNGKRVNKADAKHNLAVWIGRVAIGCLRNKETHEKLTLENLGEKRINKIQAEMNEYGFSRRSIHDTVTCLFLQYSESQLKSIHDFCYGVLKDGKKN